MYSFINDYSEGAHPKVLELLIKSNLEQNVGYGEDVHSEKAKEYIKREIKNHEVDIHFISGGTQTNLIVIASCLRPHQAVIAADTGHINVHETGAIEATGHKVIAVPGIEGKLTPKGIQEVLDYHNNEHMVQPKMVYISNPTELGTIYTKEELSVIHHLCRRNNLFLFLDGARIGSALTSKTNDLELSEIAKLVDLFYIGGTKNGALLGEALIIINNEMKQDFRYFIKQRGGLLAKGFVVGIQFEALFMNGLFYELGAHANEMAEKIASAFREQGYAFYAEPCTNQIFPILPNEMLEDFSSNFQYLIQDKVGEDNSAIRLVTSWATTQESVRKLKEFLLERKNKY